MSRLKLALLAFLVAVPLAAQQPQIPPRAVLTTPHIQFVWDQSKSNGGLPAFISVPVRLELPEKQATPEMCNELDMWFACQPVKRFAGHWAMQHLVGEEFYQADQPQSIFVNEGLRPQDGAEQYHGSSRLGALWRVEHAPGPAGGSMGWGWIHTSVQRLPRGNLADEKAWNIPALGHVATIRVNTKDIYPGVFMFNTNAVQDPHLVKKTYLRKFTWQGPTEVELIHRPGFLVVHPPDAWRAIGFDLRLGVIRHVDPNHPFDPFPITTDLLTGTTDVPQLPPLPTEE